MSPAASDPKNSARTYSSGELIGYSKDEQATVMLSLSHTPVEERLYQAMLRETSANGIRYGAFTIQRLMALTGTNSYSTVRRAREGLLYKRSIGSIAVAAGRKAGRACLYEIFRPEEIFERRRQAGLTPYPTETDVCPGNPALKRALGVVSRCQNLSRREAQVALNCVEGLTNAEIARRLGVCPQTIKFHLRNIFTKFGVKRRTELISRLVG